MRLMFRLAAEICSSLCPSLPLALVFLRPEHAVHPRDHSCPHKTLKADTPTTIPRPVLLNSSSPSTSCT